MKMRTVLMLSALTVGLVASLPVDSIPGPVPYHAFCKSIWLFEAPCAQINSQLQLQIKAFSPTAKCDVCHYTPVSVTPQSIMANHSSTDGVVSERLIFRFYPTVLTGGCRVSAQSQSIGFSTILDNGINYCNLYDLLSASGLDSQPSFMEMTNEWTCLGYELAACKI